MTEQTETQCRYCAEQIDGEPCEKVNHCRRDIRVCESYFPAKKIYFRLSPELADGEHWTVASTTEEVMESVSNWCDERMAFPGAGEGMSIVMVELTLAEVDALPDI